MTDVVGYGVVGGVTRLKGWPEMNHRSHICTVRWISLSLHIYSWMTGASMYIIHMIYTLRMYVCIVS